MIKMPIRLKVRSHWKELLSDAVAQRALLEKTAKLEQRQTGEYIRPIMLLQAQPRYQGKESLTVEVLRQTLIQDFNIPEEQIARATGDSDEIGGKDLNKTDCQIRFVITVQALREGWDCPFAYVLYSVAESKSGTAVEQILGRVLRLPKASRKQNEALNLAYAYSSSDHFDEAARQLRDGLVQNGFEPHEAQMMVQTPFQQPDLPLFQAGTMDYALSEPVFFPLRERPLLERTACFNE
jgi:type III restriction enzyme